jgi:hypothetical protein
MRKVDENNNQERKMLGCRIYLDFGHSRVACVSYIVGHAGGSPADCQGSLRLSAVLAGE